MTFHWRRALSAAAVCATVSSGALAQPLAEQTIDLNGEKLHYSIRAFPVDANRIDPRARLEPGTALDTAKLLYRHLASGAIEDAALLSNSPRRRFEVLQSYKDAVGDDGFKEVFTEYFDPENRVVAEVVMDGHSLLVWHLKAANRYAGQFYVSIGGKVYFDDTPNPTRQALRRVLEGIRTGQVPLPIP